MKNLWNTSKSLKYIKFYNKYKVSKDLALRIYTTHLLGGEKKLVLHLANGFSFWFRTKKLASSYLLFSWDCFFFPIDKKRNHLQQ